MLGQEQDPELHSQALIALARLQDPDLHELVLRDLQKDPAAVPLEVLQNFRLSGETELKAFLRLLGSGDQARRGLALERLSESEELTSEVLIEALTLPNRRVREGVYTLMAQLKIGDREIISFARTNLELAYWSLAEAQAVAHLPASPERDLLITHLGQRQKARLQAILRVLATQEQSDQMRLVIRGLSSADAKLRSNAVEALESMVGHALSEAMMPLLDEGPMEQTLAAGRRLFKLPLAFEGQEELFQHVLAKKHWVTLYLSLVVLGQHEGPLEAYLDDLRRLARHRNPYVREEAARRLAEA
jgi:HEAT repeat protein